MPNPSRKSDFAVSKIVSLIMTIAVVIGLIYAGISIKNSNKKVADTTPNNTATTEPASPEVSSQSIFYDGEEGINALTLLNKNHKVESSASSFGSFVNSIDGKTADAKSEYWQFIVNDKPAEVSADNYKTKAGDKIEWRLTPLTSY